MKATQERKIAFKHFRGSSRAIGTDFRCSADEMKQSLKDYRAVKRGDITPVLPMIVEKAHNSYRLLPPHTQAWIKKEDLVQEGIAFTVAKAARLFDPKLGHKFSTFLYPILDNFYKYNSEPMRAQERWEGNTYSLERDLIRVKQSGESYLTLLETYIGKTLRYASTEDKIIFKIDAERSFIKVYAAASQKLRRYLIRWVLQPKVTKFKDGEEYREARREFRKLAKINGFSYELAEFVTQDEPTRKSICRIILFEKHFYTYKYKKDLGGHRAPLYDCEEYELLYILR